MLAGCQYLLLGPLEQIPLLEIGMRFDLVDGGVDASPTHCNQLLHLEKREDEEHT
jgi:hypothetical protein